MRHPAETGAEQIAVGIGNSGSAVRMGYGGPHAA